MKKFILAMIIVSTTLDANTPTYVGDEASECFYKHKNKKIDNYNGKPITLYYVKAINTMHVSLSTEAVCCPSAIKPRTLSSSGEKKKCGCKVPDGCYKRIWRSIKFKDGYIQVWDIVDASGRVYKGEK